MFMRGQEDLNVKGAFLHLAADAAVPKKMTLGLDGSCRSKIVVDGSLARLEDSWVHGGVWKSSFALIFAQSGWIGVLGVGPFSETAS